MAELIVLMGPTGAGKSVQGDRLAQELGGVHLSSGNLLRQDAKIAAIIAGGQLAPAEEVERIVGEAIDLIEPARPIIFDGFPRTMSNVRWMDDELPKHQRTLRAVILIELDLATIKARLGLRDRADDSPEAVQKKWDAYNEKTQPVIEHYEELGVLRRVDGRGSIEEVQALVREALA
ncbi:MAG: adenylate kinase [Candidatus Saccharimonadales bacterium]